MHHLFRLFFVLALASVPALAAQNRPEAVDQSATFHEPGKVWVLQQSSRQIVWYEAGQKRAEGPFRNNRREGEWQYWHSNGQLQANGSFTADKQHGQWRFFYQDGQLRSAGEYRNGVRHGEWIYHYTNGQKERSGRYAEGLREGEWNHYYEDGKLYTKGSYRRGEPHGQWEYFFASGQSHQRGRFDNGRRIGEWHICIFASGPCSAENFDRRTPRISGLPDADSSSGSRNRFSSDSSNPMDILDSLDSGGVPDEVPESLRGGGWGN